MKNEKGQIVIILLLVMVVGLTVGLSVVSRSLLNVKQSTLTEESSRAFTAAEAGIEVSLEKGEGMSGYVEGDPNNLTKYDCTRIVQGEGKNHIFYNLEKDKVAQLYFTDINNLESRYSLVNKIKLYWGSIETDVPALEINFIYKDMTDESYHLAKFALDPNSARANGNGFCFPGSSSCDNKISAFKIEKEPLETADGRVDFYNSAELSIGDFNNYPDSGNNLLIFGRFRLLYNVNNSHLAVESLNDNQWFPSQGSVVNCLGTVENTGVSRRIKVYEGHLAVPDVFDYVLFNGSTDRPLGH